MKSRVLENTVCCQTGRTRLSLYRLSLEPKSDIKLFNCLGGNHNDLVVTNSMFHCTENILKE